MKSRLSASMSPRLMKPTMPKSRRARSPCGVRMRLPGCGSPWKKPSSKAILKIASAPIEATRRRSEGERRRGRMSRKRVPSMCCSVRTREVEYSRCTRGITTGVSAKLIAKRRAFSASAV
jgi:hypothetical protein